jgi:hypothetical protein
MVFFPFIAAQVYSTRGAIPLETISLILRLRWRKARKLGQPPRLETLDVSYLYFALCLVSASIQTAENSRFFWGLCVLVPWAFWPHRRAAINSPSGSRWWGWPSVLAIWLSAGSAS